MKFMLKGEERDKQQIKKEAKELIQKIQNDSLENGQQQLDKHKIHSSEAVASKW